MFNLNKVDTVMADTEEQFVKAFMLYADADDGNLFFDSAHKNGVTKDQLFELFAKGIVIKLDEEYFKPVHYKVTGSYAQVDVYDDTAASKTFFSKEKTE